MASWSEARLTHEKALEAMTAIATAGFACFTHTWALNDGTIAYEVSIGGRLQSFDGEGCYRPPDITMIEEVIALARSLDLDLRVHSGFSFDEEGGTWRLAYPTQYTSHKTAPSGLRIGQP